MLAEPIICRTYQSPRVSPSTISSVKVSVPSGKWPQKITAWAQTLRTALAVSVPSSACLPEPVSAATAGVAA